MSSDTSESFDSPPSEAPSSESSGYHLSSPSVDVDPNQQTTPMVTRARSRVNRTSRASSATAAIYATNPPLNPLPIHARPSDPATSASSSGRGVNPPSHASTHSSNSVNRSPTPLATTVRSSVAPSVAASSASSALSAAASSGGSSGASNTPFRRQSFHHTYRRIGSPRAREALRQAGRVVGPRPTNLPIGPARAPLRPHPPEVTPHPPLPHPPEVAPHPPSPPPAVVEHEPLIQHQDDDDEEEDFTDDEVTIYTTDDEEIEEDALDEEEDEDAAYNDLETLMIEARMVNIALDNTMPIRRLLADGTNSLRIFFMGIYCGDGVHLANGRMGFGFKSSFFPYLVRLLRRCGVMHPSIRFQRVTQMPVRYNTAFLGMVLWIVYDAPVRSLIEATGLPSSRVMNTNLEQLANFLPPSEPPMDQIHLACFVLGLLVADGCVKYVYCGTPENTRLRYNKVSLAARDPTIMRWLRDRLEEAGCDSLTLIVTRQAVAVNPETNNLHTLNIGTTAANNDFLSRGLEHLRQHDIPLCGKLQLLRELLTNSPNVSANVLQPKTQSFLQYLGERGVNDPLTRAVGQDLYEMNMFELNELLESIAFPTLDSIYDFDINQFMVRVQQINRRTATPDQVYFLDYLDNCGRRAIHDIVVRNFQYPEPFIICPRCPYRYFLCRHAFLNHYQAHHQQIPFMCDHPGCGEEFPYRSQLAIHRHHVHVAGLPMFDCRICGSRFTSEQLRERHQARFHNPLNPFVCAVATCRHRFTRQRALDNHARLFHNDQAVVYRCPAHRCNVANVNKYNVYTHVRMQHPEMMVRCAICLHACWCNDMLEDHIRLHHNPMNPHVCHRDHCGRRYAQRVGLWTHQHRDHPLDHICATCGQGFTSDFERQRHINRNHNPRHPHICRHNGCLRSFARVDGLILHIRNLGHRQGNEDVLFEYDQRRRR